MSPKSGLVRSLEPGLEEEDRQLDQCSDLEEGSSTNGLEDSSTTAPASGHSDVRHNPFLNYVIAAPCGHIFVHLVKEALIAVISVIAVMDVIAVIAVMVVIALLGLLLLLMASLCCDIYPLFPHSCPAGLAGCDSCHGCDSCDSCDICDNC